jgi:short-subunit dehydrogenase
MSGLVFITGASSGIGQALALRFFQAGWRLALVTRRTDVIESWAEIHAIDPDNFQIYIADVSNVDSIVAAGQQCQLRQGLPDIVIASAGISIGMDSAICADINVMQQTFATNNTGLAATFQPFIAAMAQRGTGTLVGIASVAGIRGLPGHAAYCASKAGVIAYCECLRGELKSAGVKVVTICPGYIDTPLTRKNKYPMPFLMPVKNFAEQAYAAIQAGSTYSVIPWQMGVVANLLRVLPNVVFDRLLVGRARKNRHAAD